MWTGCVCVTLMCDRMLAGPMARPLPRLVASLCQIGRCCQIGRWVWRLQMGHN